MSAQQLADACTDLGVPIQRSVLANLESGRRTNLSVPELLALAQVLQVPPLLLLVPLGRADKVEMTPGADVPTTDALLWLTGQRPLPGQTWGDDSDDSGLIALYQLHSRTVDRWLTAVRNARAIREGRVRGTDEEAAQHEQAAEQLREDLENLRNSMTSQGLRPPLLPRAALGWDLWDDGGVPGR